MWDQAAGERGLIFSPVASGWYGPATARAITGGRSSIALSAQSFSRRSIGGEHRLPGDRKRAAHDESVRLAVGRILVPPRSAAKTRSGRARAAMLSSATPGTGPQRTGPATLRRPDQRRPAPCAGGGGEAGSGSRHIGDAAAGMKPSPPAAQRRLGGQRAAFPPGPGLSKAVAWRAARGSTRAAAGAKRGRRASGRAKVRSRGATRATGRRGGDGEGVGGDSTSRRQAGRGRERGLRSNQPEAR